MKPEQFTRKYKFVPKLKNPGETQFANHYWLMERNTPDVETDKSVGEVLLMRNKKFEWEGTVTQQTISKQRDFSAVLATRKTEAECKLQLIVEMAKLL
jgi:hypothetical protein